MTTRKQPHATKEAPATPHPWPAPRPDAIVLQRPEQGPPDVRGPDRIPSGGSEPYVDAPPASPQPAAVSRTALLAGTSAGSKLFLAGLAGLVVTAVGLIMVLVRRRHY